MISRTKEEIRQMEEREKYLREAVDNAQGRHKKVDYKMTQFRDNIYLLIRTVIQGIYFFLSFNLSSMDDIICI